MTVTEIKQAFESHGFTFSEQEVEEKLSKFGMKPEDVDADLIAVWIEDFQQGQNKPAKSGKGGGLAKGKPAQPPAQAPTQPQQQVNFQSLTSTIHTTVEQLVRANHQGEQEAIAAVAAYLKDSPSRVVNGVSQQLATIDVSSPLESVLQQQRSAWASTHDAIRQAIANVNDFAGIKSDAA